jgi:DNA-directed RNA polymerase II subunit RPB1
MLSHLKLRGIEDVNKVYMRGDVQRNIWDDETGFTMKDEWVLYTQGSNFMPTLACDFVDATRTITNDIVEVFMILGIEGVRCALLNEIRDVISFDGSYVNYRHLSCLVDVMTLYGNIMPIHRYGINRGEIGPILRCTFEETIDMLMDAAIYAEEEVLMGVTDNIMMGQLARVGTGDVDLLLDEEKIIKKAVPLVIDDNIDTNNIIHEGMETPYVNTPPGFYHDNVNLYSSPILTHLHFSPPYAPPVLMNHNVAYEAPMNSTQAAYIPTHPAASFVNTSYTLVMPSNQRRLPVNATYTATCPNY